MNAEEILAEFWTNLFIKVDPDKYDINGIYRKKNLKSNNIKVFDVALVDIQKGEPHGNKN